MEWVCAFVVFAAIIAGAVAYRRQQADPTPESSDAGPLQQQSGSRFVGVPLDARLADPEWTGPIAAAGFDPTTADLVREVGEVMLSARSLLASDGMPFLSAATGILIVQRGRVGIAVPDNGRIVVASYDNYQAELNVGNTGMLKLMWEGRDHGIVFCDTNADTPEGREFGNALLRSINTI